MSESKLESKGFFLHLSQCDALFNLPPEVGMRVIKACRDFHAGLEPDLTDPIVACVFAMMRPAFDKALEKGAAIKEKRREAGRLGGQANGSKYKQTEANGSNPKQTEANACFAKQTEADDKQTPANEAINKKQEQELENKSTPNGVLVGSKPPTPPPPPCPHAEIVEIYHATLPELSRVESMSGTRKGHLQARWRERLAKGDYCDRQGGLAWWRGFFQRVRASPWLMGQVTARDGKSFRADLAWLIRPENFLKTLEGKYERRDSDRLKSWQELESEANTAAFLAMN